MKKIWILAFAMILTANVSMAKTDLNCPKILLVKKGMTILKSGEQFTYPLQNETILECYAQKTDGSIDDFEEFNDYFVMRDGKLYSNTMHKIYKQNKIHRLKKVDRASLKSNGDLKLYDPLWEWSVRRHIRNITINTKTGEYYLKGTQDNWMWYRNIEAKGFCRVMKNETP